MNRQLRALDRHENHDLKQVPCTIRADDEPAVRVLSGILDGELMVNGMADVFVGDAMLASRRMDLHENLVYYEKRPLGGSAISCLQRRCFGVGFR